MYCPQHLVFCGLNVSYGVCGVTLFPPQAAATAAGAACRVNLLHVCCSTCAGLMDDGEFSWWPSSYFPHLFEHMGDGPLHIWILRKFHKMCIKTPQKGIFPCRSNEAAVSYVYWRCWFYNPLTWLSRFLLSSSLTCFFFSSLNSVLAPLLSLLLLSTVESSKDFALSSLFLA